MFIALLGLVLFLLRALAEVLLVLLLRCQLTLLFLH